MNHSPSKRVAWEKQQPARRSRAKLHAIHDEPFVFRVKSHRSSSNHPDDDASDSSSDRNKPSKRSTSIPSARDPPYCNWKNFMKRKSRYGIHSPHALCYLTRDEQELEPRPSFINYGGHYGSAECGHKRTFNSLAVHQMKHQEVNDERVIDTLRERRLRQQAADYFRNADRQRARWSGDD